MVIPLQKSPEKNLIRNRVAFILVVAGAIATGCFGTVNAQSTSSGSSSVSVPKSAFYAGGGVGFAILASGEQSVYNKGLSNVRDGGVLVATGEADGPPVETFLDTKLMFVPLAQLGYFRHIGETPWLWGTKFSYSYLMTSTSRDDLVIPQFGSSSDPNVSSFTGFSVTRSYEASVHHQMTMTPFVGRSFQKSFVYIGAGPSLSRVQSSLKDVVGFADIRGRRLDISGRPQSFTSSEWAFGAAATTGVTYFINSSWFLDFGYSFSMPFARTTAVSEPFSNNAYSPLAFDGTLSGTYSAKSLSTHSFTISINKAF